MLLDNLLTHLMHVRWFEMEFQALRFHMVWRFDIFDINILI